MSDSKKRKDSGEESSSKSLPWDDVKKARNRINSQRTRERERAQIDSLETDKTRLTLSNDALRFQNAYLLEGIQQIREVQRLRGTSASVAGDSAGRMGAGAAASSLTIHGLGAASVAAPELLEGIPSGAASRMDLSARSRAALEQQAALHPSLHQQMPYPPLDRELGAYSSRLPPVGTSSLDELRIRQHAALEMEAELLQRHRAAAAGVGGLYPRSPSTLGMARPSAMLQVPTSQELMELHAHQLRMQELGGIGTTAAGVMGQFPRGFHASHPYDGPEAVMARNLREHAIQEAKQIEEREKARRYK